MRLVLSMIRGNLHSHKFAAASMAWVGKTAYSVSMKLLASTVYSLVHGLDCQWLQLWYSHRCCSAECLNVDKPELLFFHHHNFYRSSWQLWLVRGLVKDAFCYLSAILCLMLLSVCCAPELPLFQDLAILMCLTWSSYLSDFSVPISRWICLHVYFVCSLVAMSNLAVLFYRMQC